MTKIRLDNELPESIEKWGWKFHHLGIPTDKIMSDEKYIPQFKFYVSGFENSPFGLEIAAGPLACGDLVEGMLDNNSNVDCRQTI